MASFWASRIFDVSSKPDVEALKTGGSAWITRAMSRSVNEWCAREARYEERLFRVGCVVIAFF